MNARFLLTVLMKGGVEFKESSIDQCMIFDGAVSIWSSMDVNFAKAGNVATGIKRIAPAASYCLLFVEGH